MKPASAENRTFWTGLGVLVVVGLFLALRSEQAVRAVLGTRRQISSHASPTSGNKPAEAARLARRDSLIAASVSPGRDPFRPPTAGRSGPSRPGNPSEPPGRPSLRALLYDSIAPSVQISVGGATSGWLHRGDTFHGWTIVEIKANSVRISNDGETLDLSSS